ncbi:uncharacterized protein LOC127806331 [Diospyros lotus]|uniref:uncharacterized protein LOC127806331 n=1 Tax=Diospyros lotus TaxID=55363 RepID=UPI00225AC70E|nr:uncharacterized protein LOC127806331 [Diospyros lotus]
MARQILLRHRSSLNRMQPLLSPRAGSGRCGGRIGEVAGGTAAECAAVCCCCPCGLVNLLVLTVYRLPAGLCRRALQRKRQRQLMKRGHTLPPRRRCECGCDDTELQIHPVAGGCCSMSPSAEMAVKALQMDQDVIRLEKEMWDQFYGTGFWRSPSQRSDIINLN